MRVGEEIGWTKVSDLTDGCSDLYFSDEWSNEYWHWEYRPAGAAIAGRCGKFKLDGVEDRA